ncbi:MAG TPA: pantoate--beta-alanine ligase [Micavibrio sp.]|nr:pantoate--beta-alanine ligase [Micavibrio sp.]
MRTLDSISALRSFVADSRKAGKTVALVPTMGALHDGHIELVRQGLARADICIPYIFLNPMQFAPTEDLASYPQTLDADLEKLRAVKASAVYLPRVEEQYPQGFATRITLSGVALPLEGERRPIMFDGVATVVTKMLLQCLPDIALFGEKDWQQLQVIKRMVRDLDIPVEILGVPVVRDENGLALSSRNAYLSAEQYKVAIQLNKILHALASDVKAGTSIPSAEEKALAALQKAGFESIDYVTVRDAETLLEPQKGANLRVLAAVRLGKARLIDNMPL